MIRSFTIYCPPGKDIEEQISEELETIKYRRIISIETIEKDTVRVWYEAYYE